MKWFIIISMFIAASEGPMLSVYPRVGTLVGGAVRVTCRVPRHPSNRAVIYGFSDWTTSSRQLDGEDSPITWQMYLENVPCNPGALFCSVLRGDKTSQVVIPFTVLGCS